MQKFSSRLRDAWTTNTFCMTKTLFEQCPKLWEQFCSWLRCRCHINAMFLTNFKCVTVFLKRSRYAVGTWLAKDCVEQAENWVADLDKKRAKTAVMQVNCIFFKHYWSLQFTWVCVVSWTMLDSHLEPSKIKLCKEKVWAPEKKTWCCAWGSWRWGKDFARSLCAELCWGCAVASTRWEILALNFSAASGRNKKDALDGHGIHLILPRGQVRMLWLAANGSSGYLGWLHALCHSASELAFNLRLKSRSQNFLHKPILLASLAISFATP